VVMRNIVLSRLLHAAWDLLTGAQVHRNGAPAGGRAALSRLSKMQVGAGLLSGRFSFAGRRVAIGAYF